MKTNNDETIINFMFGMVFLCGVVAWVWNAEKFVSCDFESSYRCEAIHAIGVFIPPVALVTVWFGDDGA